MTGFAFAFPWFAVAGAVAAVAMVAAHFIVVRTGRPRLLPTARFAPRAAERAVVVERHPADLLLLALRAGALLLAGVALARPIIPVAERDAVPLVIAHLAGAADTAEVMARASSVSESRVILSRATSVTAPLIQGLQEAAALGARGHPVRLTIVSAFAGSSIDSATFPVRRLWPGRIEVERVARAERSTGAAFVRFAGEEEDPLRFALGLLPTVSGTRDTAIVSRGELTASDSAAASRGHIVVHWPVTGESDRFEPMQHSDVVRGLATTSYTFLADLPRTARFREDSSAEASHTATVRWIDGAAAVGESSLGYGCVRHVGFAAPDAGDLVISRGFQRVLRSLVAPCGTNVSGAYPEDAVIAELVGEGPEQAVLRPALATASTAFVSPMLLIAAFVLLLVEMLLRRRRA